MASRTILFGFAAVFSCLEVLEAITKIQDSRSLFATRLMAVAFVPAIVATFGLTLLLLVSYIRALRTNAAAGHADRRFLEPLAKATLVMATAALLAGVILQLVALDT